MALLSMRIAPRFGKDIVDVARDEAFNGKGWDRATRILSESFGEEILPYVDSILTGKQTMSLSDPQGNMDLEPDTWEAPYDRNLKEREIKAYLQELQSFEYSTAYRLTTISAWKLFGSSLRLVIQAGFNPVCVTLYEDLRQYIKEQDSTMAMLIDGSISRALNTKPTNHIEPVIDESKILEMQMQMVELSNNRSEEVFVEKDNFFEKGNTDGWISPQGDFYGCKTYQHIMLAEALGYNERELEDNCWCKISHGVFQLPIENMNSKQIDTLTDYSLRFNNGQGVKMMPFDIIMPLKDILEKWEKESRA
jgi:hypothetical protein